LRLSALGIFLVGLTVSAGCAGGRALGVREYYSGGKAAAEELYRRGLEESPNSRALYLLLLGNLHLDEGRLEQARREFIEATGIMESFTAEGEFEALVGAEAAKEYKGDPYERMMAWWYLGFLDYCLGDYHMALPSFKSAVFADGAVREERFMADNASGYLMTGKTYRALGEAEKAQREFADAIRAGAVRRDALVLFDAVGAAAAELAASGGDPDTLQAAGDLLAAAAPEAVGEETDLRAALSLAAEKARRRLREFSESDGDGDTFRGEDAAVVDERIAEVAALAACNLQPAANAPPGRAAETLLAPAPCDAGSLFVVAALGVGPYKYNAGLYGRYAAFGRRSYPERYAKVFVDGREIGTAVTIEDVYYQAATRGGRAMDAVLAGKAVLKDVFAAAAAESFDEAGEAETFSDEYWESVSEGIFASLLAALVRAEADVRSWETLPDKLQALSVPVEPGVHDVEVAFYGAAGEIPGARMRFAAVRFKPRCETVVYVRSGSGGWALPCGSRAVVTPAE